jgi:trimeric autotransporter adhesin
MKKRLVAAVLAATVLAIVPLDGAFARGGGGAGGGFGGGGGGFGGGGGGNRGHGGNVNDGGRGSISYSRPQSPSQQRLYDQARKSCSGARYPSGATPRIDYGSNSFNCFESGTSRR